MLKIFNRYIPIANLLFLFFESVLIYVAMLVGYVLAVHAAGDIFFWEDAWSWRIVLVTIICQVALYYNDLYFSAMTRSRRELIMKTVQSLGAASIVLAILYYILPDLSVGRNVFLPSIGILGVVLISWRFLYSQLTEIGTFNEKVVILGSGELAKRISEEIQERKSFGYEVVGFIDENLPFRGGSAIPPEVIGNFGDLETLPTRRRVDRIIVALSDRRGKMPLPLLLKLKLQGIRIDDGISFYERITGKILVQNVGPGWLIFAEGFGKHRFSQIAKRILDILASAIGLVLASPVIAIFLILIPLDSRGPAFFRQERVGEGEKVFTLVKFRSMRVDAEEKTGPVWATDKDDRVSRIGRFIRTTRIDEIPQMLNVLKGDMSFVGPRPERPFFVEQLMEAIPYYGLRFAVKPGITGWAQIRYPYGATEEDALEKLQFDLFYIKNVSILLDMTIILETIKVVLSGKGAR